MPVLEAMNVGVPVIAADRGALPEVAGSAAHFFEPDDVRGTRHGCSGRAHRVRRAGPRCANADWQAARDSTGARRPRRSAMPGRAIEANRDGRATRSPETSIKRPLRIAVDGRELVGKPTGVGRYLREVLRQWRHGSAPFRWSSPPTHGRPPGARRRAFEWWPETRDNRRHAVGTGPPAARAGEERPDVFFAPAYTAPLRLPCPIVVVIHDVSFFAHPEWFGRREGWRRRWLTRAAARHAHTVVTVSEFSRRRSSRYLRVPPEPYRARATRRAADLTCARGHHAHRSSCTSGHSSIVVASTS